MTDKPPTVEELRELKRLAATLERVKAQVEIWNEQRTDIHWCPGIDFVCEKIEAALKADE